MKTHVDLDVWKLSMNFVENIYKISATFPKEEMYALTIKKMLNGLITHQKGKI